MQKSYNITKIAVFACLAVVTGESCARAADITFLCAVAMQSTMQVLLPAFQTASGHHVTAEYGNLGTITERVRKGDAADLVIVSPPQWEGLRKDDKISADTSVVISKVGIGVSIRKGAARPDVTSVDAFKRALLNARSIAVGDPGKGSPVGAYTLQLLDRLGIANDIKPKLRLIPGGPGNVIADAVVMGGAEFGIDQMSLIAASPDVDLVGPLPTAIQSYTIYTGAIPTGAKQPAAANALINFLTSPAAVAVFRSKGLEAG